MFIAFHPVGFKVAQYRENRKTDGSRMLSKLGGASTLGPSIDYHLSFWWPFFSIVLAAKGSDRIGHWSGKTFDAKLFELEKYWQENYRTDRKLTKRKKSLAKKIYELGKRVISWPRIWRQVWLKANVFWAFRLTYKSGCAVTSKKDL